MVHGGKLTQVANSPVPQTASGKNHKPTSPGHPDQ
jgi:hypothetical protein